MDKKEFIIYFMNPFLCSDFVDDFKKSFKELFEKYGQVDVRSIMYGLHRRTNVFYDVCVLSEPYFNYGNHYVDQFENCIWDKDILDEIKIKYERKGKELKHIMVTIPNVVYDY